MIAPPSGRSSGVAVIWNQRVRVVESQRYSSITALDSPRHAPSIIAIACAAPSAPARSPSRQASR